MNAPIGKRIPNLAMTYLLVRTVLLHRTHIGCLVLGGAARSARFLDHRAGVGLLGRGNGPIQEGRRLFDGGALGRVQPFADRCLHRRRRIVSRCERRVGIDGTDLIIARVVIGHRIRLAVPIMLDIVRIHQSAYGLKVTGVRSF